jgi:hypothetical protein
VDAPNKTIQIFGFTTKADGLVNVLKTDIVVSEVYDPQSGGVQPPGKSFVGIWDTGASGTVINSKIINELNLKPSGKTWACAVGGDGKVNKYLTDTYSINVFLPNRVTIIGVVAAKGEIMGGDALIGMDIIIMGDLAVTNFNRKTTLSYRAPSAGEIDFVKDMNMKSFEEPSARVPKVGRNDPCPCGSGKKYKKCHGV